MKKFTHILLFVWAAVLMSIQVYAQPNWQRVNYTTSSIFTGIVTVNGQQAQNTDKVGVFVNGECRMLSQVFHVGDTSFVSAVVHVDSLGEEAVIKFWDSQDNVVYELDTVLHVQSHGSIKRFPIEIKSGEIPDEETGGIQTHEVQEKVTVFPSSFSQSFSISSTAMPIKSIAVFNAIGNTIVQTNDLDNSNNVTINSSEFAGGLYLVHVKLIDGTVVTKKIVKEQ
ncbi:MAG: T9SS type A sorting domain-containing protein [Bacteroidales bacterium]